MKNNVTLDLQMKLADVLINKRDIEIINQKSDLDNFLILDLQKRCVEPMKVFLKKDKEIISFWILFKENKHQDFLNQKERI